MEKLKLEMDFLDEDGQKFRLGIDSPRNDLDDISIEGAMERIISNDIFQSKGGSLVEIGGARYIATTVTEIEF